MTRLRLQSKWTLQISCCFFFLSFWKSPNGIDMPQICLWPIAKRSGWTFSQCASISKNTSKRNICCYGLQAPTCNNHTETLHYKSLLENLGQSRVLLQTCTATALFMTCLSTSKCFFCLVCVRNNTSAANIRSIDFWFQDMQFLENPLRSKPNCDILWVCVVRKFLLKSSGKKKTEPYFIYGILCLPYWHDHAVVHFQLHQIGQEST